MSLWGRQAIIVETGTGCPYAAGAQPAAAKSRLLSF
jgi:hypothetical protein